MYVGSLLFEHELHELNEFINSHSYGNSDENMCEVWARIAYLGLLPERQRTTIMVQRVLQATWPIAQRDNGQVQKARRHGYIPETIIIKI
jgi:hypothetical protein